MYDFEKEDGAQGADDFTQLLWKGTKKFGIGFASAKNEDITCTYVVARYRPTGNVAGAFRDNVELALDKRTCVNPSLVSLYDAKIDAANDIGEVVEAQPKGQYVIRAELNVCFDILPKLRGCETCNHHV